MSQAGAMGSAGRRLPPGLRARVAQGDDRLRDRLSELPDHLAHHILSFLPTKDSVRTVTLSKRWQAIWWAYPIHDFDETRYSLPSNIDNRSELIRVMIVGCLRGNGVFPTVQKLRVFAVYPRDKVIQLYTVDYIKYGITNSKLLDLDITFDGKYCYAESEFYPSAFRFPNMVFESGIHLTSLKLQACNCGPCESFNLPSLKTVFLKFVTIDDKTLELLISHCPILEELRVEFCFDVNVLRVKNPSLTTLVLASSEDLSLLEMEVPRLHCFRYSGAYISAKTLVNGEDDQSSEIKKFECRKKAGGFEELKTLLISNLTMNDETAERMFSYFRQLQSVKLVYCSFTEISFKNNGKLEAIDLDDCDFERLRVNPQSLRSFKVSNQALISNPVYYHLSGTVFVWLRSVSLGGSIYFPDGVFRFVNGQQLESLELLECHALRRIEISSQSLKKFEVELDMELESGRIEAPALEHFKYSGELCVFEKMTVSNDVTVDLNILIYGRQLDPSEAEAHDQRLWMFLKLFHFAKVLNIGTRQTDCKIIPGRSYHRPALRYPSRLNVKTNCPGKCYLLYLKDVLNLSYCVNTITLNICSFQVELKFYTPANMEDFMKRNSIMINLAAFKHDCVARHLTIVKIRNFRGSPNELELVEYLLGTATRLCAVSFVFHKDVGMAEAERIVRAVLPLPIAAGSVSFGFIHPQFE